MPLAHGMNGASPLGDMRPFAVVVQYPRPVSVRAMPVTGPYRPLARIGSAGRLSAAPSPKPNTVPLPAAIQYPLPSHVVAMPTMQFVKSLGALQPLRLTVP